MSDPNRDTISAKLWRLPGQLLLALLNATAILVIIAAVLALVAISRVDNFAGNLASTMTEAALSKIDLPSREVLANLRSLTGEVRSLGDSLRAAREAEHPVLQAEIARLREALNNISASVDRLTTARTILTDEAIGRLGGSFGNALTRMRGCVSDAGQAQPDRAFGNNEVASPARAGGARAGLIPELVSP